MVQQQRQRSTRFSFTRVHDEEADSLYAREEIRRGEGVKVRRRRIASVQDQQQQQCSSNAHLDAIIPVILFSRENSPDNYEGKSFPEDSAKLARL